MSSALLSEEQRDALQELLNISMGQAADTLARLIHTHVQLSIPQIMQSTSQRFLAELVETQPHHFAQQSFLGELSGEMLSLLFDTGIETMARLMHYDTPMHEQDKQEMLLDISNILAAACLNGLLSQLSFKTQLAPPVLLLPGTLQANPLKWQQAIWMEILFQIPESNFQARILICLKQESIYLLKKRLDILLQ